MSSYHLNDLYNNQRTYSFLPNEKDENGENLMTQSLIQAPYRRIRHPELVPVILNNKEERNHVDIMSQSLIMPTYRRVHHNELHPVLPKQKQTEIKSNDDTKRTVYKTPKRAFSMTRLDQLARPRQRYLEEALKLRASVTKENLSSSYSIRPTSSMSLATKNSTSKTTPNTSINQYQTSQNNLSAKNTISLRQRSRTAKQRPTSYAGGHSFSSNNNSTPLNSNLDSVQQQRTKTRSNNFFTRLNTSNQKSPTDLMVTSIEGSLVSRYDSINKPALPKKPAHIKAIAAARKERAKQQHQQIEIQQDNEFKKSDMPSKIRNSNGTVNRMKKSVTNPEKIDKLLDDDSKVSKNKKIIKITKDDESNKLSFDNKEVKLEDNSNIKLENEIKIDEKINIDTKFNRNNLKNKNSLFDELNNQQINSNQDNEISQLINFENDNNKTDLEAKDELDRKRQAEEEEKKRIEIEQQNEQIRKLAQEEEKKNSAIEEKERELERRAKERAERVKQQLEEKERRLKQEEEEKIQRKKRLESIKMRFKQPKSNTDTSSNNSENSTPATNTTFTQQQQTTELNENNKQQQTTELNETDKQQSDLRNPDVVEDALKSNLIKLTNNDNLNNGLNNSNNDNLNNVVNSNGNYVDNENLINDNRTLINSFKEMKIQSNSTFVFSQSSESYYAP